MINWRNILTDGLPTDTNLKYLVSDGKDISTSDIFGVTTYKSGESPKFTFKGWSGDDNTFDDNDCCSGTRVFEMKPTHWCPTGEINLPK